MHDPFCKHPAFLARAIITLVFTQHKFSGFDASQAGAVVGIVVAYDAVGRGLDLIGQEAVGHWLWVLFRPEEAEDREGREGTQALLDEGGPRILYTMIIERIN